MWKLCIICDDFRIFLCPKKSGNQEKSGKLSCLHQQPWYWLCKTNKSLFSSRKNFNHLYYFRVEKSHKMRIYLFSQKNSVWQGLIHCRLVIPYGRGLSQQRFRFSAKAFTWTTAYFCQSDCENETLMKFESKYNNFHWNKANLRDLIAATGLVILLKLD